MKPIWKTAAAAGILILFLAAISCAPGNIRFEQKPAGFFAGLWHGFISLFAFIIGLFTDKVHMYESNNVGNLYDLGFILGVAIFFGGSGNKSKRKCR